MTSRLRGSYSMEALALVSVLCIAAIFVFSSLMRQADARDQEAYQAALKVKSEVQAYYTSHPMGKLTKPELAANGVEVPAPLVWEVPAGEYNQGRWEVRVWHPQGRRVYLAGPRTVAEEMR